MGTPIAELINAGTVKLLNQTVKITDGPGKLAAVFTYQCPNANIDDCLGLSPNGFIGIDFAGSYSTEFPYGQGAGTTIWACKGARVQAFRNTPAKGVAKVVVWFKSVRRAGYSTIRSGRFTSKAVRARLDVQGNVVEGPDTYDHATEGLNHWRVVAGSPIQWGCVEMMVVESATASLSGTDLSTVRGYMNKVNSAAITGLGLAAQMGLLSGAMYRRDTLAGLWYWDFFIAISPYRDPDGGTALTWNQGTKSQKGCHVPISVPVMKYTGGALVATGDFVTKRVFLPDREITPAGLTTTTSPEPRSLFKTANYSGLFGTIGTA